MRLAFAAAVTAAACLATPASAALLARPGGFYYDTVLDITWMGDANYAKTIGFSDTGLVSQQGASYLADGYLYFNEATKVLYSDWRLPTLGPDVGDYDPLLPGAGGQVPNGQGAVGTGWGTPEDSGIYSELGWMYYANLGGQPRCVLVGPGPCEFNPNYGLPDLVGGPDKGPFANLQLDFYWTDTKVVNDDIYWAFTFDDGNQNPRAPRQGRDAVSYVWLVHDGDIAAVPEPATWALMIAGFGMVGAALRRRRTAQA
ncbi:PEPxxWA-CTERM sorting domain-containing protein [Phenylobacterium sp.]|uniref:PEPxxWA-CTERM sorting domain-containing protein n=1 Tax=Phenylobacterium sp. TaxID=1871053 RepID=UPI0025FE3777|nr:PEPxxWA-CTERM sorting domain-containing protein [Phenylobacterium sp.]